MNLRSLELDCNASCFNDTFLLFLDYYTYYGRTLLDLLFGGDNWHCQALNIQVHI